MTIPVLWMKETAGVFCVFLKHSEDKILFRIYWARGAELVFAIELLNRLFKGCKSYSEHDTFCHHKCGSIFKSTTAGFLSLYITFSVELSWLFLSWEKQWVCMFVCGTFSAFSICLSRTFAFGSASPASNSCSSQGIESWECPGTLQQSLGMFAVSLSH